MALLYKHTTCVALILLISHAAVSSCPNNCKSTICSEVDGGCPSCDEGWFGRHCQYPLECYTGRGFTYNGTTSITENNVPCQHWTDRQPNNHSWTESLASSVNYCRNPNANHEDPKPWCYQISGDRWGLCNISKCEDQCPAPALGAYGDVINPPSSGFYVGIVVEIICEMGKKGSIWCQTNKTWATHLECSARPWCTKPIVNEPGYIDFLKTEFYYKDQLVILCREGYEIVGDNTIMCGRNKTWSEAPTCKLHVCPDPKPNLQPNSFITKEKVKYVYQDVISIQCTTGYVIQGQSSLRCNAKKVWNGTFPHCSGVPCKEPVLSEHTMLASTKASYQYKDSINLTCSKGYELKQNNTITCQADMTWGTIPVCTAVTCPQPQLTTNSAIVGDRKTTYVYQDIILIVCRDGSFSSTILKTATCLSTGLWEEFKCPENDIISTTSKTATTPKTITPSTTKVIESSSPTARLSPDMTGYTVGTVVAIIIAIVAVALAIYSIVRRQRNNPTPMKDAGVRKSTEDPTYDNLTLTEIGANNGTYENIKP